MNRLLLAGIIIVALLFRVYAISTVPPSPSLDEVSIGYNAYSILRTGRDEYGTLFPLLLRAYDDYRPALYVYLTVPFVWAMGLTATAVRMPSVILSVITVYVTYQLGKRLSGFNKALGYLGIWAAAFLALSPWHIYISRLGHEANLGLALTVLGMYWLISFITNRRALDLVLSAAAFGLSFHGYQSQKAVVPLMVGLGLALFRKELFKNVKLTVAAGLIAVAIALPAVLLTFTPEGLTRLKATSAFPENARKVTMATIFADNYLLHFSPLWLFTGDNREAHKVPGLGLLYLWEAPLLLAGLWAFTTKRLPLSVRLFLIGCILIAPVPAAITTQAPHAMRSFTFIPVLQLVEAAGLVTVAAFLSPGRRRFFAALVTLAIALGMVQLLQGYFVRFPAEQSDSFQYAIRDAISFAAAHENEYTSVEFSNQDALYQSYMFYLYYRAVDPKAYLNEGGTLSGGFEAWHRIGRYAFGILPTSRDLMGKNILYMYDVHRVPYDTTVIRTFSNADGKPAIAAVTR